MADVNEHGRFDRLRTRLEEVQVRLREQDLDGWLLYDLHLRNPVAARLLGQEELSRRYFVLVPATGEPQALVHGIEEAPWDGWPWSRRRYVGWRELREALEGMVGGRRVAMEIAPEDAVPALDLVPAGVAELVRAAGAEIVSSAELVTRFHSCWTEDELASHRRAARVLAEVAREAFQTLRDAAVEGATVREGELRDGVLERLEARGCGVGADCIVAVGPNAADPHYHPGGRGASIGRDEVVLLDLWAKEDERAIYADQTWMAFLGERVPERVLEIWTPVREARDAAVDFVRRRWSAGRPVQGFEVDDVARGVIAEHGYADAFIHRTGHSIDRETHGMGPNIDNLETHEVRRLIPGVGFSIEPGIYLPGEIGVRSEIDVYLGGDGPEVTTPAPQDQVFALLDG